MVKFDDIMAHQSIFKNCVERGMKPKQMIEKMSSTQQFSFVNRQVEYEWHRIFSTEWEDSLAKKGQPAKLNKGIL